MYHFMGEGNRDNTNNRWMGEKYDGIRCCWNSTHHVLYLFIFFYIHFINLYNFYFVCISDDIVDIGDILEEDMNCHLLCLFQIAFLINLLMVSCGMHNSPSLLCKH